MPRNLFIAVILSTCLQLTALARTPRVVSLQKLPQVGELQKFYRSLHVLLDKQAVKNKANEEFVDLTPLQQFLKGEILASGVQKELETYREEYAEILGNEVAVADLLKYSELQALAEGASSSDTQANEYIELVDSVIKELPTKDKLYLFTIKLTLAGGTEMTLIKPGMSVPLNIKYRVENQINSLEKIAFDPSGVTFNIHDQSLDVVKMEIESADLGKNKKYLDLNYGVADTDVHRQLVANGYQMVHDIPNIKGGERKEVFVKLNGEDSAHVNDVVTALEQANDQTYLERQAKTNGLNGNSVSLSLPAKQQAKLIFADIQFSATDFKTGRARLAKMLLEIKWYEHRTGNDNVAQQLRDKFDERFKNSTGAAEMEEIERLSQEVFVLRRIISALQAVEGGSPAAVALRLGLGKNYSYASHLEEGLDTLSLVAMGITINNEYPKHKDLHKLFGELLNLRDETEKVNAAREALHASIDMAGGWRALQAAMQGDASAAAYFLNALARAALRGETAERMAEVVLSYRIISALQAVEKETSTAVGRRLGLGQNYSYVNHLSEELDTLSLVAMGITIDNEYPKHKDLHKLFGELLNLRDETEKVNAAREALHASIDMAGGWRALQVAMQGDASAAAYFLNALARAALSGETAERMAEVVLSYRIISALQAVEGGKVAAVALRLGLSQDYSYASHLRKGLDTLSLVAMDITINTQYYEHEDLPELFNELLKLKGEEVSIPIRLLHASIDMAGGWRALQVAMQGDASAAAQFRNALAAAALRGETAERMAEVVLSYRIISALQAVEGGYPAAVVKRLGWGNGYSYASHLSEGLDTLSLVAMGITIDNEYPKHKNLHKLFGELLNLRDETEKVNAAREALHASIDMAGGWRALQAAMQGDASNALARAALRGETAERIAEVVLLYRIISAIQVVEGGKPRVVGSKLGLSRYSYVNHLQEGQVFDLQKLETKIEEIKNTHNDKKLHNNLDDSMQRLQELRENPKQLELLLLP